MSVKRFLFIGIILPLLHSSALADSGYGLHDRNLVKFCNKEVHDRAKEGLEKMSMDDWQLLGLGWNPGYWLGKGLNRLILGPAGDSVYSEAYADFSGIKRCAQTAQLDILSNAFIKECDESTKNQLCLLGIPKKPEEFLTKKSDISANIVVGFKTTASEDDYRRVLGPQGKEIAAMTLDAQNIWKELLECFDQDPELARTGFAFNLSNVTCVGSIETKTLQEKINLFKTNFYNALLSNEHYKIDLDNYYDNRLQFEYFFQEKNEFEGRFDVYSLNREIYTRYRKKGFQELKPLPIHPLISQLALQIMVKFYKYAGPNDFFKLDSKYRPPNQDYVNLYNNALRILIEVNNKSGAVMGLWPNAGWAVWRAMNERLMLFADKLYFTGDADSSYKKSYFAMFYSKYLTNYGVFTSSFTQANLPEIYFKEQNKLINQYFQMEDPYQNLNLKK